MQYWATWGHTCICTTMQRSGADVGSQLDMHIYTDAGTHSRQGMGPDKG